jgi:hypothetical protein
VIYNVNDISTETKIYHSASMKTNLKAVFVDKREVDVSTLSNTYQFNRTGIHAIRYRYSNMTAVPASAFTNCTAIYTIRLPKSVNYIYGSAFENCSGMVRFTHKTFSTFNTMGNEFMGCTKLEYLDIAGNLVAQRTILGSGNPSKPGILKVTGNWENPQSQGGFRDMHYKKIYLYGNLVASTMSSQNGNLVELRIFGNCSAGNATFGINYPEFPKFIEIMGNVTSTNKLFRGGSPILHFGYGQKITASPTTINVGVASKIYVGPGNSEEEDQTILNEYLADEAWAAFSNKLDLWYNYNGQYKE